MLSVNCIEKTSSNLIMCKVPQITKRPLQPHSITWDAFFSCFMLYFSSSQIIYWDLKYIVYVFMNAMEPWKIPINSSMGVQGRSDKEKKKRNIAIFSTVFLHFIGHFDFFQNPWCHYCRKEDKRNIEILPQKTFQVYNFRWIYLFFLKAFTCAV